MRKEGMMPNEDGLNDPEEFSDSSNSPDFWKNEGKARSRIFADRELREGVLAGLVSIIRDVHESLPNEYTKERRALARFLKFLENPHRKIDDANLIFKLKLIADHFGVKPEALIPKGLMKEVSLRGTRISPKRVTEKKTDLRDLPAHLDKENAELKRLLKDMGIEENESAENKEDDIKILTTQEELELLTAEKEKTERKKALDRSRVRAGGKLLDELLKERELDAAGDAWQTQLKINREDGKPPREPDKKNDWKGNN